MTRRPSTFTVVTVAIIYGGSCVGLVLLYLAWAVYVAVSR